MKEKKVMSVLELPLKVEPWQADDIDKRMEHARVIYNKMLSDRLKAYNEMVKTKEWREVSKTIKEELQKADGSKKKSQELKDAYERRKQILMDNSFTEFGFKNLIKDYYKYYNKTIPAQVAGSSVAEPMWRAFDKLIYGNGERVHFKRRGELNSLVSPRTGLYFRERDGKYFVIFSNQTAKARTVTIPVKIKPNDYNTFMLTAGDIKQCRVLRRLEKGYYKKKSVNRDEYNCYNYYVQLVIEAPAYIKLKENGEPVHKVGEGTVGIGMWRNMICAVSQNEILYRDLVPGIEEFESVRNEMNRTLEYLRRQNNPDNYNDDGTIKKGIIDENGKRVRLKWHYSNNYKKIKANKREFERVKSVKRDLLMREIAYQILEMGDTFYFMDPTSFLTTKPEWNEEEPLSNNEYKKKKQRRKAIQEAAPSTMLARLDQKLLQYKKEPVNRIKIPDELYWFQHQKNTASKEFYIENKVMTTDGNILILPYFAFLMRHYDAEHGCYDVEACEKDWKDFLKAYKNI